MARASRSTGCRVGRHRGRAKPPRPCSRPSCRGFSSAPLSPSAACALLPVCLSPQIFRLFCLHWSPPFTCPASCKSGPLSVQLPSVLVDGADPERLSLVCFAFLRSDSMRALISRHWLMHVYTFCGSERRMRAHRKPFGKENSYFARRCLLIIVPHMCIRVSSTDDVNLRTSL